MRISPQLKACMVPAVCVLYLLAGPVMIFINKTIIKDLKFHYPMAVAGLGLLATSLVSSFLVHSSVVRFSPQVKETVTWKFWLTRIMAVGAGFATTLACGNAVYMYLTLAFIQMSKAFTPCTVMFLLYSFGISTPSRPCVYSVAIISVGTAISAYGELHLTAIGVALILGAEVGEATRVALTQYLLQNLKFSLWEGQYYLAPASALWLLSASSLLEGRRMLRSGDLAIPAAHPGLFVGAACMGVVVNLASFLVIQVTSSVTLKLLGTVRNAALVLGCAVFLGEQVTALEAVGYSVSLTAFGCYNYYKMQEMQEMERQQTSGSPSAQAPSLMLTRVRASGERAGGDDLEVDMADVEEEVNEDVDDSAPLLDAATAQPDAK